MERNASNPEGPKDPRKRDFLNYLLGGTTLAFLAALFYPVLRFLYPGRGQEAQASATQVRIGKVADIPPGKSVKFRFGKYPSILINFDGTYYAYGAICTHLGCIVHWKDEKGCAMSMGEQIHCVCHAGHYNPRTGEVISGPPPSPLPRLKIEVRGGEVYALEWEDPNYVKSLTTYL